MTNCGSAESACTSWSPSWPSRSCGRASEGTLPASDLREAHQIPLPEGEFETVAGFMLEQLGSVPKGGEVVYLPGWRYTIVDVEKNRISKVKIDKVPVAASVPRR